MIHAQGWGCLWLLSGYLAPGWEASVPREPPAPPCPDTGRSSFPILLPCCWISTLNAITNTSLSKLFLQTVLMPGTTCLCCKREIPKRMEKIIFHFQMEFCFDIFISLLLCYCKILEYLDCKIIAVSNKSNKYISCAYVVTNVTRSLFFLLDIGLLLQTKTLHL